MLVSLACRNAWWSECNTKTRGANNSCIPLSKFDYFLINESIIETGRHVSYLLVLYIRMLTSVNEKQIAQQPLNFRLMEKINFGKSAADILIYDCFEFDILKVTIPPTLNQFRFTKSEKALFCVC